MDTPAASSDEAFLAFATLGSRTNGVLLAFAIIHLSLAVFFLLFTRRFWRVACALALGLAVEWLVFALSVNVGPVSRRGFSTSYSDSSNDLALFGLMVGLALLATILSFVIPKRFYVGWWLGWLSLGLLAGASIGVTLLLFRSGQLLIANQGGRWGLIAGFAVLAAFAVIATRWRGATIAGCILGAWLLALGIDLLLNTNTGTAYGLRVLLDRKDTHRPSLQEYQAPLSTCLIFGLSWLVALVFAGFQEILYGRRNFLPTKEDTREGTRSLEEKDSNKSGLFCFPKGRKLKGSKAAQSDLDLEKNATKESAGAAAVYSRTSTSSTSSNSASSHGFSTVPDSEIRALTQNYQRALEALDNSAADANKLDEEEVRRRSSVETQSVPITYMPNANDNHAGPRVFVVPNIDEENDNASVQQEYQRRYEAAQTGLPTSVPMQRSPAMFVKRAESDRGTTYSVPLTNITNSEYHDRDRARPPSWVGNLPWDPSMLRGPLDPGTLPRHPEDTAEVYPAAVQQEAHPSNLATLEAPRVNMIPAQQADPAHPPQALAAAPLAIVASTMMVPIAHATQVQHSRQEARLDDGQSEADYEVVNASDLPQTALKGDSQARPVISRPFMHAGSPTPSPYASRSVDGDHRDGSVSTAGVAPIKRQRVQRTSSRDERLHLDDDDLPENNEALAASPQTANFPFAGDARPSVDNSDLRSSSLGSPSFARQRGSSDITPLVQDLPPPRRPTVIPQHSPIYSNVASVTEGGSPATGSEFFTPFEGSTSTLRVPQVQPQPSPAGIQPEEERKQVRFLGETSKQSKGRRGIFRRQKSGLRD